MLKILVATCETTLDALNAADNPVDGQLIVDLEKLVARTRAELARVGADRAGPPAGSEPPPGTVGETAEQL